MDITELVRELEREVQGQIRLTFHGLSDGHHFSHHSDESTATASTYKLPLLIHLALEVGAGRLSWDMPLALTDQLKSWGTGVLRGMSGGTVLPLRDVCYLMTVLSDNTATDMLIDRFGVEGVNQWLRGLGLEHTRLVLQHPRSTDLGRPPLATGVTTAREMAELMLRLATDDLGLGAENRRVIEMLEAQQDRSMVPRLLPLGWRYAGKTGSNPDLRADVGLVTGPKGKRFVLSLFCQHPRSEDWSVDSPGVLALARLAYALLEPTRRPFCEADG